MKKEAKEKPWLRVIGDVHNKQSEYIALAKEAFYSLCVGDVGFEYSRIDRSLDYHNHKIVGGNHDNYTKQNGQFIKQPPHFTKDFGQWGVPGIDSVFYMRGAWSIDRHQRVEGRDWWKDEELTYTRGIEAIELYKSLKPKLVVTHCCPSSIVPMIPFKRFFGEAIHSSITDTILENMYELHQPDIWLFGHYHVDWRHAHEHPKTKHATEFICLNELSHMDFVSKEGGGYTFKNIEPYRSERDDLLAWAKSLQ